MRSLLPPLGLLLLTLLLLPACNRKTSRASSDGLPAKRTAQQLLSEVSKSLYVPQRAEMKGDMEVNSSSLNMSFSATIRTQADSAFWVSLRKLGFEGARALVTRDSIIALNRLQREAMLGSSQDLPQAFDALPFAPTLDNLLAAFGGQPIGNWQGANVERLPGHYTMRLPADPSAVLELRAGPQPVPVRWTYQRDEQFGEVIFADFREAGKGQLFPYRRTFTFSDFPGDTTRVVLDLSSLTPRDALDFPLSIPRSYRRSAF